jgi:glyoxylase-like metal-dependent hydrolase (beta-lactamase superfamily II)
MPSTSGYFQMGEIRIARVEESCQPAFPPEVMFPDLPAEALQRQLRWLAPNYYDPQAGLLVASIHSWVVRTRHHTILIDTCGGNHKERPGFPALHQLDLPWLDRLAAVGVAPEQVDFVMCTHLHLDHVGWNTRLKDGRWVPTFPHARYLFSRTEYDQWTGMPVGSRAVNEGVIEDSVLPVIEAGQSQFVEDGYTLDDMLTVEATPGHTAGHVMIRAKGGGAATGLFIGDIMHNPIQVPHPDINSGFCQDPAQARAVRRRVLSEAAEHNYLLLPAHFGTPHVGRVRRDGEAFAFIPG